MIKFILTFMLMILAWTGRAPAQEKIAEGRLVFNRWLSWEEVQGGTPPADGQAIGYPWIFDGMAPSDAGFKRIGAYWYALPPLTPGFYQLSLDFLNHGYTAWLWNAAEPERRLFISGGQEGLSEDTELRTAIRRIVPLVVGPEGRWFLVINFSFQGRDTGGLWSEPRIAPGHTLETQKHIHSSLVYATSGSLIIMVFYMTMMFVRRRDDYPSLFLALICLGLILRIVGVEMILCELLDPVATSLIYNFSRRMEYLSVGLLNFAMLPFITTTFRSVTHSKHIVLGMCALSVLYMLSCCFRTIEHVRTDVLLIQILAVFNLVYLVRLLIRAIRNKEEGAYYMLAASILPIVIFVLEILHSRMGGSIRLGHFAGTLFVFLQSQLLAKRFASAYSRAAHLSVSLQSEVEKQTSQIRHIMDHIPEGLFIIDRTKTITPPYSNFLQAVFPGRGLTERPILDLFTQRFQMPAQEVAMVDSILEASLGEDCINWELNREHMAEKFLSADNRTYRLHWHPIENQGQIVQFLGIIHDVTELQRLEAESREQEEDFRILREFLFAPKTMIQSFLHKQTKLMELMFQACDREITMTSLKTIFVYLHTLKGNARQLHLKELSDLCHATEEPLRLALTENHVLDRIELVARLRVLETKLERYRKVFLRFFGQEEEESFSLFSASETSTLRLWLESGANVREDIRLLIRSKLGWDLKDWIEQLGREQLRLAESLGKATPSLILKADRAFDCPVELRDALLDALGHLFRNSLVHGVRAERGTLHVGMEGASELERLTIYDDGPGLDVAKIKQKACELQLIAPRQRLTFHQLAEFIFAPVFSTADAVSDLAGRGMGMNAVRLLLEPFGSVIYLEPLDPAVAQSVDVGNMDFVPFRTVIVLRASAADDSASMKRLG
ncbi:7TM diverse intracellular signaling domain-containing protein [Oligoflexus tunisiensis]|uniref:7TM diverse intracellular signaling domain-containing protein n=1 Tax=Oligoflexus tunisiensis TaxID=708132 RepID=UPI00159EFC3F|nr:7TM diverse intracellular signaling domain-containing protein [Oligoflexus tunisiensis]